MDVFFTCQGFKPHPLTHFLHPDHGDLIATLHLAKSSETWTRIKRKSNLLVKQFKLLGGQELCDDGNISTGRNSGALRGGLEAWRRCSWTGAVPRQNFGDCRKSGETCRNVYHNIFILFQLTNACCISTNYGLKKSHMVQLKVGFEV